MATTTAPLVWSFNRALTVMDGANVGGVAHFYDETAQDIFTLSGGMYTRLTTPTDGHWRDNELSSPSQAIDSTVYSRLDLDHPVNGTLYFAAIVGGQLRFMRYVYAADISNICDSVTHTQQIDNPVTQITANIKNVDNDWFDSEATLFNPGARMTLGVSYGSGAVYPLGVAYLDDCTHDPQSATVPVSGQNAIGFYLKTGTFGSDAGTYTGDYDTLMKRIMGWAGVRKYNIMDGSGNVNLVAKASDTFLSAIDHFHNVTYYNASLPMAIRETADGTVVAGYCSWLDTYLPPSYYTFSVGKEVFKRKTKKTADAAYSGVYVTGKAADNTDLAPVQVAVNNYAFWYLPSHKYKHITAPATINTQAALQWYAEKQAEALQYVGIGEEFTSPLRPQLLVGDVAELDNDGTGVTLGIITEVRHAMGANGFTTMFSVDSGGVVTTTDGNIRTTASAAYGFNRRQRITDVIAKIAGR